MKSFYQEIAKQHQNLLILPKKKLIHQFVDELFWVLFSNTSKSLGNVTIIEEKFAELELQFNELVLDFVPKTDNSQEQTKTFFKALPDLHKKALSDAKTIFAKDPAAKSLEEVLYTYPGFFAIAIYRFSHQIWTQNLKLLARTISEYAHSKTSIEIHPGA